MTSDTTSILAEHGIRPTAQRVAVAGYVLHTEDHPSADEVWTRVYLCESNRWVPLSIETPQFTVHEVALEYDPIHKLAVLLWPPRFEQDIRPHLFRPDVSQLQAK